MGCRVNDVLLGYYNLQNNNFVPEFRRKVLPSSSGLPNNVQMDAGSLLRPYSSSLLSLLRLFKVSLGFPQRTTLRHPSWNFSILSLFPGSDYQPTSNPQPGGPGFDFGVAFPWEVVNRPRSLRKGAAPRKGISASS